MSEMIRRDEITSDDVDVKITLKLNMRDKVALLCIDYLGVHAIPTAQIFKESTIIGEGIMLDGITYYWDDVDDIIIKWPVI